MIRATCRGRGLRGAVALGALAAGLLVAGCATEEPPPDVLPLPPEPPARVQSGRQPAGAARPRGAEAEPPGTPAEPAPAPAAPAAAVPAAPPPGPPPAWRVARDGTLGCADPAPLRLLRQGSDTPPRLLAEARAAGACRTTFRVNAWVLETIEGDVARLRLMNGEALTLWFLRVDLVAP